MCPSLISLACGKLNPSRSRRPGDAVRIAIVYRVVALRRQPIVAIQEVFRYKLRGRGWTVDEIIEHAGNGSAELSAQALRKSAPLIRSCRMQSSP